MRRCLVAAGLAVAAVGANASGALAATFCVNPVAGQTCSGTTEPDLQTALTAAGSPPVNNQRNTVIVGNPGAPPSSGYTYSTSNPATNPVNVIGAGENVTTLTFSGGSSSTVLTLRGDGSSVSNVKVVVPAATGGAGLVLVGGSASRVLVTSPSPQTQSLAGIELLPGSTPTAPLQSVTHSSISYPTIGTGDQALIIAEGAALIQDDALSGQNAGSLLIVAPPSGYPNSSTVRRVSIFDPQSGTGASQGLIVDGQTVSADNLTESIPGSGSGSAVGAIVSPSPSADGVLNLNHASFSGDASTATSPASIALIDESSSSGRSATTNVRNSVLYNFFYGTDRSAGASSAAANVRYDYSDYDQIHRLDSNSSGGTGAVTRGVGDLNDVDPGWLNPAFGDFRLPAGSPVINAGDPAGLNPAVESTTDVLGRPRISGGRRDMGAVEFQFPPPTLASKGSFKPKNRKVKLNARCNEPATDACSFRVTLTGKVTEVTHKHGHKHRKRVKIKVVLTGTVTGGRTGTLSGKLSRSALKAIGASKHVTLRLNGTATDRGGTSFALTGRVKLTRQR